MARFAMAEMSGNLVGFATVATSRSSTINAALKTTDIFTEHFHEALHFVS
jgi:hypothetical protein